MKTVLITGAAHGIGLATARHYAAQGWFVGLYDINRDGVESLLSSGNIGHGCAGYVDVTNHGSLSAMFDDFDTHSNGRLDLFVNNAGVLTAGAFADNDASSHDAIVDVNVRGATHALQLAFPLLKATPGATVVNLCSASSIHGIPGLAVYSASKFYIDGLTEALDIEWREHGIRVTCVKPPVIKTSMGAEVENRLNTRLPVTFVPEDVAVAIQRAAEGRDTDYFVGWSTWVWSFIDRLLPNPLRHALTRYLCGG
jgi:NAD(P)-dependent dehydrogenase (short-subunit alcohol dehydrogenase family)